MSGAIGLRMIRTVERMTRPESAERNLVLDCVEDLLAKRPPSSTDPVAFLEGQFDAGLAWVDFPIGEGGLGVDPDLQLEVSRRLSGKGAPDPASRNRHGYFMGSAILRSFGKDSQRRRYLRPMFTGVERWCQLFSEPGAGSDLAGLACRAVRDGDEWIINGQKVWSSGALGASIGMLVTRSDPEVPKHRGLTYFLLDMASAGVEIRPLRQMTGDAEFCEVFLTDVRIPDAARLGSPSNGWGVTVETLMAERFMLGGRAQQVRPIDLALGVYGRSCAQSPVVRDRLMNLWSRTRVLEWLAARLSSERSVQGAGPKGSLLKVGYSALNQDVYSLCVDMLGAEGSLYGEWMGGTAPSPGTPSDGISDDVRRRFLRATANSIEGGTSEIMLNILAERVLGLPPDMRVDKDVPWSEVPRN